MISKKLITGILISISFATAGCGIYSFSGSSIPTHIKSVAIPLFDDRTAEFGIKEQITDALIDEFIKENILQIRDEQDANSIIRGTITRVTDVPYTFDASENVQEFKVNIYVDIEWYDQINNIALYEGKIVGWGVYPADAPDDRELGLEEAVERLRTEIINQTLSGW